MANPFHSTGSPIVDRMCRLQFTGNVIPAAWYRTIIRDNGKPNLTAIIILSDVVYWYRPVEIRDELTGQLCGFKKKFKADILQRNSSHSIGRCDRSMNPSHSFKGRAA